MNRTKIDWCDYTWNPVTGCLHGCPYCYARRMAQRFGRSTEICDCMKHVITHGNWPERCDCKQPDLVVAKPGEVFPAQFKPTFYPHRLGEPREVKKPARVFTVSSGDLFGDWVPREWIESVLQVVHECPWHEFLFLTKNPIRYREFDLPPNAWAGTTVTNQNDLERIGYLPLEGNRFISIEPLLGDIDFARRPYRSAIPFVDWIIIGAQTGPGAVVPDQKWVQSIIDQARARGIPVFIKENVRWPEVIREFPETRK